MPPAVGRGQRREHSAAACVERASRTIPAMNKTAFFLAATLLASAAHAQVTVADPWVRTTVA